jgi:hypothetical protein
MNRAYSPEELLFHENTVHDRYRLGPVVAKHDCGHKYRTKRGGRKESFVLEQGVLSSQTCSVCFKLRTTDGPAAADVQRVCQAEDSDADDLTPGLIEAKSRFYSWLYQHLYN